MCAGTSLAAFLAPSEARASSSISAIPRVAGIRAAIPPLAPLPCGGLGVDKSGLAGCEPEDSPEGAERIPRLLFQLRPCGGAGEGPWRAKGRPLAHGEPLQSYRQYASGLVRDDRYRRAARQMRSANQRRPVPLGSEEVLASRLQLRPCAPVSPGRSRDRSALSLPREL